MIFFLTPSTLVLSYSFSFLKFTTHIKFKTKFSKDFSSVIRHNSQHFGLAYESENVLIFTIQFESKNIYKGKPNNWQSVI